MEDFKNRYNIKKVNPNIIYTKLEYELIQIKTDSSYEEALTLLDKNHLRGATIEELLLWKDWDMKSQVIAMGSIFEAEGNRHVACLHVEGVCTPEKCWEERKLSLLNTKFKWFGDAYLLGVKEV